MAKCFCPGDLKHRVTIEALSSSRDAVGGHADAWAPVATVWASIEPKSAGERWMRHQMQAQASWSVGVRYRPDITTKHRLKWGARVFEIRGVTDADMKKRFLDLACEELVTTP